MEKMKKSIKSPEQEHAVGMARESAAEVCWRKDSFIAQGNFHEEESIKMSP